MSVTINASTSTGLVQSADTSGEIELQSNGTTALKVNTNEGIQILNCLGVGGATPSTSGAGITFPATQSASTDANTLDDYEEGTFSPSIAGTVTSGTATYSSRVGTYTKIGNLVTCIIHLNYSGGTGSGALLITGLPFTTANDNAITSGTFYYDNIAFTAGWVPINYLLANNTVINFLQTNGGVAVNINYDAAGVIVGSIVYRTA